MKITITVVILVLTLLFFVIISTAHSQVPIGSTTQIFSRPNVPSYDYAPANVNDRGIKMFWCGSRPTLPADHIFFSNARLVTGPFHGRTTNKANTFDVSLQPSGNGFDKVHVCDPTVIKFTNGKWYLYYSGLGAPNSGRTAVGVAYSNDGYKFNRLNSGRAILISHAQRTSVNGYGTGQPSSFVKDGYIYLIYTDTFGVGTNPGNGAGQFVLRSKTPTFQSGVERWTPAGFQALQDLNGHTEGLDRYLLRTQYSLYEAFSVDWAYNPVNNLVVIANHNTQNQVSLQTFNATTFQLGNLGIIPYTKSWVDGPALLKNPNGTLSCPTVNIFGSFGANVYASKLNNQKATWDALCY